MTSRTGNSTSTRTEPERLPPAGVAALRAGVVGN